MTQVLLLLILAALLFGGAAVLGFLEVGLLIVAGIAVIAILVFILKLVFTGLFTAAEDFFTDVREWFRFLIKNRARLPYWLGLIFWIPYRILWGSIGAFRAKNGGLREKIWNGTDIFMALVLSAFWMVGELAIVVLLTKTFFGVDLISR